MSSAGTSTGGPNTGGTSSAQAESPEIEAFLKVLDPQDNATGGGAASAVAGAMAAGLAGMVARVSRGKPDMASDDVYDEVDAAARRLTGALMAGARDDSSAFEAVMRAYRMPKNSEEEKSARSAAIQAAMERATEVPLSNAEACAEVLDLCDRLRPRHNANAKSDLDVGRRLAEAALAGCIDNVEINVGSLKNEAVAGRFRARVAEVAGA